jgi:hypothetical protein
MPSEYDPFSLFSSCHSESRPPTPPQAIHVARSCVCLGRGVTPEAGVRSGFICVFALSDGGRGAPGRYAKVVRPVRSSTGKHLRALLVYPRFRSNGPLLMTFQRQNKCEILTGATAWTDASTRCPTRSRRGGAQAAGSTTTSGSGRDI